MDDYNETSGIGHKESKPEKIHRRVGEALGNAWGRLRFAGRRTIDAVKGTARWASEDYKTILAGAAAGLVATTVFVAVNMRPWPKDPGIVRGPAIDMPNNAREVPIGTFSGHGLSRNFGQQPRPKTNLTVRAKKSGPDLPARN